ncbi:MAG: WD40/YVTN/BNR-like repeat-containing protein [bacterium]
MRKSGLLLLAAIFMAMAGCGKKNPVSGPPRDLNPKEERWVAQTSGTVSSLNAVHFLNKNEGWVAGANATLLRTNDGGANWSAVSAGLPDVRDLHSVHFIDQNAGWIGGLYVVGRTLNGGANWGGVLYSQSSAEFRNKVFPISATQAWAIGKTIVGSFTGRAFWRYTYSPTGGLSTYSIGQSSSDIVNDVFFTDADNGWGVGTFGRITRISDASATQPAFNGQTSGTTQELNSIHMLNGNVGFVAGAKGTILKTTDGGNNWTTQVSKTTLNLNAISFLDANRGIAVGDSGKILSTTDGGASWTSQESGTTNSLRGVHFVDANAAYAVGINGAILKRTAVSAALAKERWMVAF